MIKTVYRSAIGHPDGRPRYKIIVVRKTEDGPVAKTYNDKGLEVSSVDIPANTDVKEFHQFMREQHKAALVWPNKSRYGKASV